MYSFAAGSGSDRLAGLSSYKNRLAARLILKEIAALSRSPAVDIYEACRAGGRFRRAFVPEKTRIIEHVTVNKRTSRRRVATLQ